MTTYLIIQGLLLYGARFAFSGIDNGLYYASRRGLNPERDTWLPDIHIGEDLQQWSGHLSALCLGAALILETGWSWWLLVAFMVVMIGASYLFAPVFQWFIQEGAGGKTESTHYVLPLFGKEIKVRKVWANRRHIQFLVGLVLFVGGILIYHYA